MSMTGAQLRSAFLDYFAKNGHKILPSASLVPGNDPSLLFTNAGMVQFKEYFLGQATADWKRATTAQRCLRVSGKHNDLENVGYTARHHTLFEMLGNFSFGDYFKKEAIFFGWDFLTREVGLDGTRMTVSVFREDDEAYDLWHKTMGIPASRVVRFDEKDNFWSMGATGRAAPAPKSSMTRGGGGVRSPRVRCGVRLRPVSRDLEPRVHAVQPGRVGHADRASEAEHRHRDGARAACRRGAGGDQQLRHGPVPADPRRDLPAVRRTRRNVSGPRRGDAGRRRPRAGHRLPHRRRDRPLQRGTRVRAPPDHAPGAAPREETRVRRSLPPPGRGDRGRGVPGGVPGPRPERVVRRHGGVPGGAAIPRDARRGPADGRGGVLPHVRGGKVFPGEVAFKLYDTYGFPADLTADLCRERGVALDSAGFEKEMERQRAQSRVSWKGGEIGAQDAVAGELSRAGISVDFVGYERMESDARVVAVFRQGERVASAAEARRRIWSPT